MGDLATKPAVHSLNVEMLEGPASSPGMRPQGLVRWDGWRGGGTTSNSRTPAAGGEPGRGRGQSLRMSGFAVTRTSWIGV